MDEGASAGGGAVPPLNDGLRVRTFPDKIIVDLSDDPFAVDYVLLDEEGATFTASAEKVRLTWVELRQLMSLVAVAEKQFRPRNK